MQETGESANSLAANAGSPVEWTRESFQVTAAAFTVLFCIVGMALWGLPFYYDFMVRQFGWTRGQVTSGNALSKLVVGPLFGFFAGWMVDRFGPRRLMLAGILMAGAALIGLGSISTLGMFYFFYMLNALGYVCGGPLPSQVLLSRWFERSRGKAMGFAYLGIGLGGAVVPWISHTLVQHFGWQAALRTLGLLILAMFAGRAPRVIYIFAAVFGIGLGGDYMIVPLMTAEIFGVQLLGRLLGVILTAGSVAEAVSPWLVGRLRDLTGSYSAGFLALVAVGLLGAASAAMLPRGKQSA